MPDIYAPPSFDHQIDMSSRPGSKWQIMTYVSYGQVSAFAKGMTEKGLFCRFQMVTKLFDHKLKTWIFLTLRAGNVQSDYIDTRKLTRLILVDQKRPLYWKEGKHGYQINEHGKIMRKWELGTGYVVPFAKGLDLPSS